MILHHNFYNLIDKKFEPIGLEQYAEVNAFLTDEFIADNEELKTAITLVKLDDGQKAILEAIVDRLPAPKGDPAANLHALIFDCVYNT